MKNKLLRSLLIITTIIGFSLSPLTFGDDFYANIPFSVLFTWLLSTIVDAPYYILFTASYIFSNIFGLILFIFSSTLLRKHFNLDDIDFIKKIKPAIESRSKKLYKYTYLNRSKSFNNSNLTYLISFIFLGLGFLGLYTAPSLYSILLCLLGMISILIILNIPSVWIEDAFATISNRLKISALLAGGLFLAIASSSTEFFTSLSGVVWYKVFSIGFDTLVWSSLFNLCMILGVCTFYKHNLQVDKSILRRDMPFYGVTILLLIFLAIDGIYSSLDFIILIAFYFVYVLSLYFDNAEPYQETTDDSWSTIWLKLFFGLLAIALLAHSLVTMGQKMVSISEVSFNFVLPVGILAATLYGPGTSIADMFMSIAATKKGEDSAAVINTIGSNTFDLTICLGIPGLIYTLITGENIIINLYDSLMLLTMLGVSYFIVYYFIYDNIITKNEGMFLIAYYLICTLIYVIYTFY